MVVGSLKKESRERGTNQKGWRWGGLTGPGSWGALGELHHQRGAEEASQHKCNSLEQKEGDRAGVQVGQPGGPKKNSPFYTPLSTFWVMSASCLSPSSSEETQVVVWLK